MKSAGLTPSSTQKPRRSHLDEFLPLYKKLSESNVELKTPKTFEKHDLSSSKIRSELPKHQNKQAVDISQIIIDGTNLNNSAGNSTPLNESKVTSTPLATKKRPMIDKLLKKSTSTIEHSTTEEDVSVSLASSKSQKRSKSVSFLIEEKDQEVVKKHKPDGSQDGATGDSSQKAKKLTKNKKSEKENNAEDDQMNRDEPATKKKNKKYKNKAEPPKSEVAQTQSVSDNVTDPGDNVVKERKLKKHRNKGKMQESSEPEANQLTEKTKKAKKQKHQDNGNEGEPVCKSPKTEFIDNLENLNLGDNTHTLTNLIDEMAVVDKAKQRKKKKTAHREKKQQLNQNLSDKKQQKENVNDKKQQKQDVSDKKQLTETETDGKDEVQTEKKKWVAKRWNKRQVAEKAQNTTINVDNLPVPLLKGNFKKVLIDHFSKYGLSRSVGQPIIQNEEDSKPMFSTKVYFDSAEAAAEALEMDGSSIAGHEIRVSAMRPMTETVLVVRIYGHPDKLSDKDIKSAFGEVGLIRSIKPMLRKKKTMATVFIEFDGPKAVERALQKCTTLKINGKQVMASAFQIRANEKKKKKRGGKKKAATNEVADDKGADDDSGSDSDDE